MAWLTMAGKRRGAVVVLVLLVVVVLAVVVLVVVLEVVVVVTALVVVVVAALVVVAAPVVVVVATVTGTVVAGVVVARGAVVVGVTASGEWRPPPQPARAVVRTAAVAAETAARGTCRRLTRPLDQAARSSSRNRTQVVAAPSGSAGPVRVSRACPGQQE